MADTSTYREFIERSRDGFVEVSLDGRITLVNRAALEILEVTPDELTFDLIRNLGDPTSEEGIHREEKLMGDGYYLDARLPLHTLRGTDKYINLTSWLVRDEAGNPSRIQTTFRDVTARAEIEENLVRRNQELDILNWIGSKLSYPLLVEENLQEISDRLAPLLGADSIAVFVANREQHRLELAAFRTVDKLPYEGRRFIDWPAELFGPDASVVQTTSLMQHLFLTKKSVWSNDLERFGREKGWNVAPMLRMGMSSGIMAPLRYGEEVLGLIAVASQRGGNFTERDVKLIENVAARIALSLRNKLLFESTQRQVQELDALSRVQGWLEEEGESPESLKKVVSQIERVLSADRVVVYLKDEDGLWLAAASQPDPERRVPKLLDHHRRVLEGRETLVVHDLSSPEVDAVQRDRLRSLGLAACIGVPLSDGGAAIGILFVNQRVPRRWREDELRLVTTFARQIAGHLQKIRLLRDTQDRVRELESVADMSVLSSSLLDEDALAELSLDAVRELLGVPIAVLHLLDGDRFHLPKMRGAHSELKYALQMTPQLRSVFETRRPLLLDARHPQPMSEKEERRAQFYNVRAAMLAPILTGSGPIGLLSVVRHDDHLWTGSEVRSVQTFANQLATAIANARLYREQIDRAERMRLLSELSQVCSGRLEARAWIHAAADKVRLMLDASQVSIRLLADGRLTLGAASGYESSDPRAPQLVVRGMIEEVIKSGRVVPISDLRSSLDRAPHLLPSANVSQNAGSLLLVPLAARDESLGLLSIFRPHPHEWSDSEIQFGQTIGNTIAISLSNARLFESLVQERGDLEMTLNSVFSGVFTTDPAGVIQTWNRAAEDMTGLSAQAMRGKNWAYEVAVVDGRYPDELVFEAMAGQKVVFGFAPRTLTTADGRVIPLSEAAASLRDADGQIRGAVGAFWDRTRERQAEQARLDFMHEVSHELRNSLTVVLAMAGLLRRSDVKGATREKAIEVIGGQVDRIKGFSERFLGFEADQLAQPVHETAVDVRSLMDEILNGLSVKYPDHPCRVTGACDPAGADPERLETALINLLDNAFKFSPPGGPVSIELKNVDSGLIRVAVRNEAAPIPVSERERIFQRGHRSPDTHGEDRPGSGIGLWLAQNNIREMGGQVCLDCGPERGVTFYFTLKRIGARHVQEQGKDPDRGRRQGHTPRPRRRA